MSIAQRLRNEARYLAGRAAIALGREPGDAKKIFVIGSGRSGTHWLGYSLGHHPDIHVEIEEPPVFGWIVEMARRPHRERDLFPKLVDRYRAYHALVAPMHFADKSHPNIWLAEKLAAEFPEARFVGIRRKLLGTVASMMKHSGVRHWAEIWDEDPRPSRFLGVTTDLLGAYREMSIEARCAVRVVAHSRELDRLKAVLGPKVHIIEYEALQKQSIGEAARLTSFLGLEQPIVPPPPEASSLDKWKSDLSPVQVENVRAAAALLAATSLLEQE